MGLFHEMFWTFWLRVGQAAVHAAPTVLCGVLVAWCMRVFIGHERLRRFLGEGRASSAVRAWVVAVLLPVCSFGVLPIACELHRARVRVSTIVAFLCAAPVFNVWSLIYGVTAMPASAWVMIVASSLGASLVTSTVVDLWYRRRAQDLAADTAGESDHPRNSSAPASWWWDACIGLASAGALAAILPAGAIEHRVCGASAVNLLWIAGAMIPSWISPEYNVVLAREAFRIGVLPGAALPITLLGGGLSMATVSWLSRRLGAIAAIQTLLVLLLCATATALAANALFAGIPRGVPDSHGFDALTQPYHTAHNAAQGVSLLRRGVLDGIDAPEAIGLIGLIAIGTTGLYRRRYRRTSAPRETCVASPAPPQSRWHRPLPPRAIIGTVFAACIGLVALCVYTYYPPVEDTLDDIDLLHTDMSVAVRTRQLNEAHRKLTQLEALVDRLPICAALRMRHSPQAAKKTIELRTTLGELSEAVARDEESRSRSLALTSHARLIACREAYLEH